MHGKAIHDFSAIPIFVAPGPKSVNLLTSSILMPALFWTEVVRRGEPLSEEGLAHVEALLTGLSGGNPALVDQVKEQAGSFGEFVRGIVGLDPRVAQARFTDFLRENALNSVQIEFINRIVSYLSSHCRIQYLVARNDLVVCARAYFLGLCPVVSTATADSILARFVLIIF